MKINRYLLSSTLIAATGSFLFGFDTAVISGTTEALRHVFQLTSSQLGFTVANALVGTIVGSLLAGKLAELLGRKRTLTLLGIAYLLAPVQYSRTCHSGQAQQAGIVRLKAHLVRECRDLPFPKAGLDEFPTSRNLEIEISSS